MATAIGRARQSSILRALGFGSVAAIAAVSVWGALASPTVVTGSGDRGVIGAYMDARSAMTTTAWLLATAVQVAASLAWLFVVERRRLAGTSLWDLLRDRDAGAAVPAFIFWPLIMGSGSRDFVGWPTTPDLSAIVVVPAAAARGVALAFVLFAVLFFAVEVVRSLVRALRRRRAQVPGGLAA